MNRERNCMRKNSIKNTRINMEVQRELSEIIRTEVKDPGLNDVMVTVVSVAFWAATKPPGRLWQVLREQWDLSGKSWPGE